MDGSLSLLHNIWKTRRLQVSRLASTFPGNAKLRVKVKAKGKLWSLCCKNLSRGLSPSPAETGACPFSCQGLSCPCSQEGQNQLSCEEPMCLLPGPASGAHVGPGWATPPPLCLCSSLHPKSPSPEFLHSVALRLQPSPVSGSLGPKPSILVSSQMCSCDRDRGGFLFLYFKRQETPTCRGHSPTVCNGQS